MKAHRILIAITVSILFSATVIAQQVLVLPDVSQRAEVKQRIGLTDVDIVYHSPLVNGRKILGELVPYGKVWRAGANENTIISFSDDVTINGSPLAAGTYGLHMIPGPDEWTIIFSKNHTSWGSFFYDEKDDALRIKVKPAARDFQEWLDYNFTNRTAASADVTLSWDKVKVSFTAGADVNSITLRHIREQLKNQAAFGWHGWEEAAHYCVTNKTNYDEALKWISNSMLIDENYTNEYTKAQLLTAMGNNKDAADAHKKVLALAELGSENGVNLFGYQLMNEKDLPTAIDIFKINVKKHPDSWNVYDSMGEAYKNSGDKKQAASFYKTALSKAPDDQKDRIQKILSSLEKTM